MKRALCTCALLVLAAMATGCPITVLEDIGTDPHPPTIEITAVIPYVAPPPAPAPATPATTAGVRSGARNAAGFTVRPGDLFQVVLNYADAGGDIMSFTLYDLDGPLKTSVTPTEQTYFSGTSGTLRIPTDGQALEGIVGRHRIQVWAEDSHLSRSEKLEFDMELVY